MSAANGSTTVDAVVLDGASKQFNGHLAVENVSLTVPRGSIVGVIGPSGAGKTTTVRLLTGALAPTAGTVRVLDQDPRSFSRAVRERIGYMPQLFTLYPDLTAGENVDFVASLFGMLWLNRRRRVREVLELVELWDARGRKASDLSGGMQRRLELASALVHDPDLLFLDEPTAGIDPLLRARIWEELHRLKDAGRTLLVTTQYVTEAEECDRVALIADGRLIAFDTPEALRRSALGGDVIEVETAAPFDSAPLEPLELVRSIERVDPTTLRISVDDAGAATPLIVDAIGEAGGEVASAREIRPSFDDVFAVLVEREHARQAEADGETVAQAAAESGPEAA